MALTLPYPLVNGVRHSWTSVEISVAGLVYGGVTEINYAPKLEGSYVRGAGALPIGQTTGLGEYSADFTMLLEEANQFMAALQGGFMTAVFDIQCSYSDEGYVDGGLTAITDTVSGCRITEVSAAASNGSADAIVRKFTLKPMGMKLNGLDPMPNMPSLSLGGVAGAALGVARRIPGL